MSTLFPESIVDTLPGGEGERRSPLESRKAAQRAWCVHSQLNNGNAGQIWGINGWNTSRLIWVQLFFNGFFLNHLNKSHLFTYIHSHRNWHLEACARKHKLYIKNMLKKKKIQFHTLNFKRTSNWKVERLSPNTKSLLCSLPFKVKQPVCRPRVQYAHWHVWHHRNVHKQKLWLTVVTED